MPKRKARPQNNERNDLDPNESDPSGKLLPLIRELEKKCKSLDKECARLRIEVAKLQYERNGLPRCLEIDKIHKDGSDNVNSAFRGTTGLTSVVFKALLWNFSSERKKFNFRQMSDDELYLTMVRLRTGLSYVQLQHLFWLERREISNICRRCLENLGKTLESKLKSNALDGWTPERILNHTPKSWSENFAQYKYTVIADVTLLFRDGSTLRILGDLSYSQYKHHNAYALLRLTTLDGIVIYNGELMQGATPKGFQNLDVSGLIYQSGKVLDSFWADSNAHQLGNQTQNCSLGC